MEKVNGMPYLSRSQLAEWLNRTLVTVDTIIKEIEQNQGRYGNYAVIKAGGITLVNQYVLIDFMRYRKALKAGATPPPFEIMEVKRLCGE